MRLAALFAFGCTPVIVIQPPPPQLDASVEPRCHAIDYERIRVPTSSVVFPFAGEAIIITTTGQWYRVPESGPFEEIALPLPSDLVPMDAYVADGLVFIAARVGRSAGRVETYDLMTRMRVGTSTPPEALESIDGSPDGSEMFGASRSGLFHFVDDRWDEIPLGNTSTIGENRRKAVALYLGRGEALLHPRTVCADVDLNGSCLLHFFNDVSTFHPLDSRITAIARANGRTLVGDGGGNVREFSPRGGFAKRMDVVPQGAGDPCRDDAGFDSNTIFAIFPHFDGRVFLSCHFVHQDYPMLDSCRPEPLVASSVIAGAAAIGPSTFIAVGRDTHRVTLRSAE